MDADSQQTNHHSTNLTDHFLLAMPSLSQGIFHHSITYICDHGDNGAMGIVVNQPLELTLHEIFDHLQIDDNGQFDQSPVMAGGPVHMDHGFVLHRLDTKDWDASLNVTKEVKLTTSKDILTAIAHGEGPEEYLIALGYAGWAPGQLEEEIAKNSWLTVPADSDIMFTLPYSQRLEAAAASLGVDINLISGQAGHA